MDILIRGTLPRKGLRFLAACTTETAREAEWRHLAGRAPAQILAELLTGNLLIACLSVDPSERTTLQMNTDGVLGSVMTDADCRGWVRGFTSKKHCSTIDRGPSHPYYSLGNHGTLTLSRSKPGLLVMQSHVELKAMNPALDLAHVLETSDQIPSCLALATVYAEELTYAGGLLVQALPDHDVQAFVELRERCQSGEVDKLLLEHRQPELMLDALFAEGEREDMLCVRPAYRCTCSREKACEVLMSLGLAEIESIRADVGSSEVACHFCGDTYHLGEDDLDRVIEQLLGREEL